ncbi:MAG TPA: XrtA system polysaccharide deacetylase [Caulobacteraceae bacterium]|jgi:polysaccharide deacetylase family protein (PEP-CTERM system associated)
MFASASFPRSKQDLPGNVLTACDAPLNALTVDVEDYFQVQALAGVFPVSVWESCEPRVERNTERLLEVFSDAKVKATFFVLGWVAERFPQLIGRIAAEGHEVASHGFAHQRVDGQSPREFRSDIRRARRVLEDAAGTAVRGYRAPTFSVGEHTPWVWRILEEEGYAYSSSIYPVRRDLYGAPDAPLSPYRPAGVAQLVEAPISALRLAGRSWPCGGGGYFRLLPYPVSRALLRGVNADAGRRGIFYLHPWEIDPDQPRARDAPLKSRMRHYLNLNRTEGRLRRLLRDLRWDRMDRVFAEELGAAAPAAPTAFSPVQPAVERSH